MTLTARNLLTQTNHADEGWEHYMTGMSDDGTGVFKYDRPTGDTLTIECRRDGTIHAAVGSR